MGSNPGWHRLTTALVIMFMRIACIALLVFCQIAGAEELRICTLAGCSSQVHFPIAGLPTQLPAGTYRVEASINGRSVGCAIESVQDQSRPLVCHSTTGAPWVVLSFDGEDRYIAVRGSAPRHVHVALYLGEHKLGEYKVEPGEYRVFEPNGRKCGPTCLFSGPYELRVEPGQRSDG